MSTCTHSRSLSPAVFSIHSTEPSRVTTGVEQSALRHFSLHRVSCSLSLSLFFCFFVFLCVSCLSLRCQKMLFFLLPVVALLLSARTTLSSNEKWPSAAAQYGKDRSWNRFRDVSCAESPHTLAKCDIVIGVIVCVPVCVSACVCWRGHPRRAPRALEHLPAGIIHLVESQQLPAQLERESDFHMA